MMTPEELATLRFRISHHKCVSKVVAISVERMESMFEMIDAQAAKIAELEQRGDHFLTACRRAVLALAAASQENAAYRADYEAMDRAIRAGSLAKPCSSQTADSEPQAGLRRNGEAQECPCNACHKEKLATNPPADRMGSLMALASRGMVLCPTCGNKRCPHANDHSNACTCSNEPGQVAALNSLKPDQQHDNAPPAPDVIDMNDPANWQEGDIVLRIAYDWMNFVEGCEYKVHTVRTEKQEVYIGRRDGLCVGYTFDMLRPYPSANQYPVFQWLRHGDCGLQQKGGA